MNEAWNEIQEIIDLVGEKTVLDIILRGFSGDELKEKLEWLKKELDWN